MSFIPVGGRGVGAYKNVGDWTWEFYPGAYSFLAPADSAPQPAPILYTKRGLGCGCGCKGAAGGCGGGGFGDLAADFTALTSGNVQPLVADVSNWLTSPGFFGVQNWMLLAAAVGVAGLIKGVGPASSANRRRRY
jgi:hypothetical protein